MRRALDVTVAFLAGVGLLPVALVIAALVRWRLGPPVLFRQRRTGRHGVEFDILKFRTMRPERFPGEDDLARITVLGKALRVASLDELPQLWNVFRGQMALIGPRPTLPEQVVHYSGHQRRRLEIRPGITGWAQVRGRNAISWPERIELDIWYIDHRSWWLDLRIIGQTVVQLLRPRGVTGEGGVNQGFPVPSPADPEQAPTTPPGPP